jgi:hypothetical protein
LVTVVVWIYAILPSWTQPVPPIFVIVLLSGAVLSLVLAINAGSRGSRLWFLITPVPVVFFLSVLLNFEQPTEVRLVGTAENATFVLSGSGSLTEFVIFRPEYSTAAESPKDNKLALWRIEPADHESWGDPVWRIHSIRYGIVPKGYVQSVPLEGKPEPLQNSERPYALSVTTASAAGTGGYFTVENGRPQWAKNPPRGPCFTMDHGKYVRVSCDTPR